MIQPPPFTPPHPRRKRLKPLLAIGAVAVLVIVAVIYFTFDPTGADSRFFPRCMFKQLTGLQCPGCGSQRAFHAMLHGNFADAWRFNAILILEIPLLLLLIIALPLRKRHPRLHNTLNSRAVILTLLAIIILWTIVRNCLSL